MAAKERAITAVLTALEATILKDPGNRGARFLLSEGDFGKAVEVLNKASIVGVCSGFAVPHGGGTPETDGPPGAAALAACLVNCGKKVVAITDCTSEAVMRASFEGIGSVEWVVLPVGDVVLPQTLVEQTLNRFDFGALFAVERVAAGHDGRRRSMKGNDMSLLNADTDSLFIAGKSRGIPTIGSGDGGNELGMGKVLPAIEANIPMGREIGCHFAADMAIACGICNWSCWALGAALLALNGHAPSSVLSERNELERLKRALRAGAVDGVRGLDSVSVDGLDWSPIHTEMLADILTTSAELNQQASQ